MYVFGSEAFDPNLTPFSFYGLGISVFEESNELGQEIIEFAGDLATILNLPQTRQPVRS